MNIIKDENQNMGWNFDNSYIELTDKFYTRENPVTVESPKLTIFNRALGRSLGLNIEVLESNLGGEVFTGNLIPQGAEPISQAYAGHQFGYFTMLGDGRASLIGEHITPRGERYDIQLKGSGRTRYSRGGDGRAALGPMLREYIISESLYGLGIPTTRSLAVATTGERVAREDYLTGAILTRVASSHIRVGTFQFISAYGSRDELRLLAEYTLQRHFPNIIEEENRYLLLLKEVVTRQAELIAKWQIVGFIHGVMNTDNMTISGESIDFGPCAFMDIYDPKTVFSSIDRQGRYAYGNQADIAVWNLSRFADTLLPLIHDDQEKAIEIAREQVSEFYNIYNDSWLNGMRAKLGLFDKDVEDKDIIDELLNMMEKYRADFTNTFRGLTIDELKGMELFKTDEFMNWKSKWENRLNKQGQTKEEVIQLMKENNPSVIPRNHRVEEALAAAVDKGDLSLMKKFLSVLEKPYEYTVKQEEYANLPPKSYESYTTFCGT